MDIAVRTIAALSTAYLLARPVLHPLLNPGISALVGGGALAAAGRVPLWQLLVAGLVGLIATDVLYWWAGLRYEHRIRRDLANWLSIRPRTMDRAERLMGRRGGWILLVRYFQPVPNPLLQVLAGAGGMRLRVYLLVSVLGGCLWLGTMVGLGWALGRPAVAVIDAITDNALKVTVVVIVLAVVWQRLRARRDPVTPPASETGAPRD